MKPIRLTCTPRETQVVAGTSFPVELVLTSTATDRTLVEVQAEGSDTPFEYELRSPGHVVTVGKDLYEGRFRVHPGPPRIPNLRPLRSGESSHFVDDIATWLVEPLPAGDYTLVARWRAPDGEQVAADPVSVSLMPARPGLVIAGVDYSAQYALFAFSDTNGEVTLFQRTSEYGRPDLGRTLPRRRTSTGITGLALATEVDDAVDWRWLAWLEGETFRAIAAWGEETIVSVDPITHALANATLLPIGWQAGDGAGLFALLGSRDAKACMDLLLMPKGGSPQRHSFELGPTMPSRVVMGCFAKSRTFFDVVRADVTGDEVHLSAQRIDLAQPRQVGASRPLLTARGPLRALEVAPLLLETPVVDALVGDTYHRLPLLGGPGQSFALDPLPAGVAWSIPAVPHPRAPVLALAATSLFVAEAAQQSTWTRLTESSRPLAHPRLLHLGLPREAPPGRLFAAWFDELWGFTVSEVRLNESR